MTPTKINQDNRSKGGWRSVIFIICVEMADRFAYQGIIGNLIMYLTNVLGLSIATAAKRVNSVTGVSSIGLLFGAFVADSLLGRFRASLTFFVIFLSGLILLTLSSSSLIPQNLHAPLFFTALYVIAMGDGGQRPSVQTFGADQFEESTPKERKAKSSFFNWWFLGLVVGSNTGLLLMIYMADAAGWTASFATPAVVACIALVAFLAGSCTYKKQLPVGSPFTKVAHVLVAAARKWRIVETKYTHGVYDDKVDKDGFKDKEQSRKLVRTKQFRFLDKAAIIDDQDMSNDTKNPWRLCTVNQVEEVKLVLRLIPLWLCTFGFTILIAQVHTFFIKQAATMDRSIGPKFQIPPAALQVIPGCTILLCVPLYDKVFVPFMRKITKIPSGITVLQRIGVGLALCILNISIAALVETKRVNVAKMHGLLDKPKATVPVGVAWLVPQFFVMGIVDLFTYVGMLELFYDQMPDDMRSLGSALTNASIGAGAFISSGLITVAQEISSKLGDEWLVDNLNRAQLKSFYWVLAGICTLNLGVYVLVSKWFLWKKLEDDQVVECKEMQHDDDDEEVNVNVLHPKGMESKDV